MINILNIIGEPIFDDRIVKIDTHTYNPFTNTTFEYSDDINAGWNFRSDTEEGHFKFCVPLSMLFDFCEDYKRLIVIACHELILIRAHNDYNCLVENPVSLRLNYLKYSTIINAVNIEKRSLSEHEFSLMRSEYPLLQNMTKHSWAIKMANLNFGKKRYAVLFDMMRVFVEHIMESMAISSMDISSVDCELLALVFSTYEKTSVIVCEKNMYKKIFVRITTYNIY
ncbi:hypothetical protein ALC56_03930 [Trachymyrmex septentrionalis]|uniref:Double jelly roll-like domain-containing protein n=1 Tax=Trachymyrmex septentrionalis TaxID=34720 RepID=A0A151JZ87_9HYME|nr:hypothetical protein ALC56_03930 [Trachymyrmex septentrionalis]